MDIISKIKAQCDGRWDVIIKDLTGFDGKPTHCPHHGGKSGKAFYGKRNRYAQTGIAWCNTCGCQADGIATISFILNRSISDTLKILIEYLGGVDVSSEEMTRLNLKRKSFEEKALIKKRRFFRKALNDIVQLIDQSKWIGNALSYFEERGIKKMANCYYRDIRFVASVTHYENDVELTHDALIFLLRNQDGKVKNVQRLFLNESHNQKAECDEPKKLMPSPKHNWHTGSAVRLKPKFDQMSGVEHVCEGGETGLSILSQAPVFTNMNCCLTAGNLAEYEIAPGTKHLVIWSDHDASYDREGKLINTGGDAALTLKERAESMGIKVDIIAPIQIGDWLNFPEECKSAWQHLLLTIKREAA